MRRLLEGGAYLNSGAYERKYGIVNAKSKTNTKCYENLNAICHKTIWCLLLRNNMANDVFMFELNLFQNLEMTYFFVL